MAKKETRRVHRGRACWKETVTEFATSGQSQGAFARERGLKPSTLGRWIKVLGVAKEPASEVGSELIEIVASPPEHLQLPRVPADGTGTTRLHIGGATVEFSHLPPVPYMAELLRAVTTC